MLRPSAWPPSYADTEAALRSAKRLNEILMLICAALVFVIFYLNREKAINGDTTICAAWLVDRNDGNDRGLEDWMVGILSAGHVIDIKRPDRPPYNVFGWIDAYCAAHPLESIRSAAQAFGAAHPRAAD